MTQSKILVMATLLATAFAVSACGSDTSTTTRNDTTTTRIVPMAPTSTSTTVTHTQQTVP